MNACGSLNGEDSASAALLIGVGRFAHFESMSNIGLTRFDDLVALWRPEPENANGRSLHQQMVAACCRRGPFLPAEFGLAAFQPEALRVLLKDHGDRLRRALASVEGCVEIAVEVGSDDVDARDGSRSTAIERLETIAQAIRTEAGLQDSQSKAFIDAENPRLRMALLAPSVAAFTIADRLEKGLRQFSADHFAKVSGPWPPYHFSELGLFKPLVVTARSR